MTCYDQCYLQIKYTQINIPMFVDLLINDQQNHFLTIIHRHIDNINKINVCIEFWAMKMITIHTFTQRGRVLLANDKRVDQPFCHSSAHGWQLPVHCRSSSITADRCYLTNGVITIFCMKLTSFLPSTYNHCKWCDGQMGCNEFKSQFGEEGSPVYRCHSFWTRYIWYTWYSVYTVAETHVNHRPL